MTRKARSFFRSTLQKSNVDSVCLFDSGIQELTGAYSPVITHALQEARFPLFLMDPDQSPPCLGKASKSREVDHATFDCNREQRTEKKKGGGKNTRKHCPQIPISLRVTDGPVMAFLLHHRAF